MKLKLSGIYSQDVYKWIPVDGIPQLLSTGRYQELPMQASVEWKDGILRFRFNSFEALTEGEPLPEKVWVDKIKCAEGLHTSTWRDMSGGEWYGLTGIGPYLSHAQDCSDFRIGVIRNFCSLGAKWWHRRWKGADPDLRYESVLMYLDDKSVRAFADLYAELDNPL